MHVAAAVTSAMHADESYFGLTVCVGLAVTGLLISRRIISKAHFGDTLSIVLMIPFVNILMLCVIVRYFSDSSIVGRAGHARTASAETRVVSVAGPILP